MKLRKKTILIIVGISIAAMFSISIFSRHFLLKGFERIERDNVRRDVERLLNTVNNEINALDLTARDWAAWDDTYRFVKDGNAVYMKTNLGEGSLANLRVDLMAIIDESGRVVFGRSVDRRSGRSSPLPEDFLEYIGPGSPMIAFEGVDDKKSGMIALKERFFYLASRPIITSDRTGPVRGAMVFGRALDQDRVIKLSKIIRSPVTLVGFNDPNMPVDFKKARFAMESAHMIDVNVLNKNVISGYAVMKDLYGRPVLIFRVDAQRDIMKAGLSLVTYFILFIFIATLFFATVFVVLIERAVVSPVVSLSSEVEKVGKSRVPGTRVNFRSGDEFSNLASSINDMLSSLEESIAGQRFAEEALTASEDRYRTTLENVTDIIYSAATDGTVIFVTPNVARWGYKVEDIIGHNMIEFVHPDDRELVKKDFEIAITTGSSFPTVCRLFSKDGEPFYVEEISNVIREGGEVTQLTGVIRDISERRKGEDALRKAQKKLDEVRRLSDIGTLAATVAHELRNPLSVIQTAAYNIKRKVDDADIARHVEGIKKKVEESNQIINNLLFYSRIREARPEDVKICWLLDEAVEAAKGRFTRNNVVLERKYHDCADITAYADPSQMKEVFNNVINNAYQAIEDDTGNIKVEVVKDKSGYLEISVTDNGCGIDEADIEKIFDPFYTTKTRGTGLGLTISYEFVRLNNGTIKIESKKGEGTKVTISLPISSEMRA